MKTSIIATLLTLIIYACKNTSEQKNVYKATISSSVADTFNSQQPTIQQLNTSISLDTIKKKSLPKFSLGSTPKVSYEKMIMISSGQSSPYRTVNINGCEFDLVTKQNDTIYIATTDKKFLTPEGFNVGTKFSDLPDHINISLTKEPGWAYYYQLPSNWTLGFCEGNSCTDNYPNDSSKVRWIFKRR